MIFTVVSYKGNTARLGAPDLSSVTSVGQGKAVTSVGSDKLRESWAVSGWRLLVDQSFMASG